MPVVVIFRSLNDAIPLVLVVVVVVPFNCVVVVNETTSLGTGLPYWSVIRTVTAGAIVALYVVEVGCWTNIKVFGGSTVILKPREFVGITVPHLAVNV